VRVLFVAHDLGFIAPIGVQYLSAVAKTLGWETRLAVIASQHVLDVINQWEPDMVAYSSCTGEHKYYHQFNKVVSELHPEIWTIMGGPHPTFFPDALGHDSLDAVCVGEGEGAFGDFLLAVENGSVIHDIPNLRTKDGYSPPRPLVRDLDTLPVPDVSIFYGPPDSWTTMGGNNLKSFITGRGCPYNCSYCFNHAWKKLYSGKGKLVRRHSVDYILDLLKYVKKNYPLAVVKFYDDVFAFSLDDWLVAFGDRYPIEIGLPFYILTRADLLTEDIIKVLKEAGCTTISMSIEHGRESIRNDQLRRNMSDQQILDAFALCKKYGIMTFSNTIVGLPDATIADDVYSVKFNIKAGADYAEFPVFHPYPGTDLGNSVIERGLYDGDFNAIPKFYMGRSPLNSFSEQEKDVHSNIALLGMIAVVIPRAWPAIRRLIRVRHTHWVNKLYTVVYQIIKTFMIRRIYPTNTPWREFLPILWESFRQEFLKHEVTDG